MRIGVDAMGGDYAPENVVLGAILAQPQLSKEDKIVLFGDEQAIKAILEREKFDAALFDIVPTSEVIEMGEHPAKAFQQKVNSSITVGFMSLAKGKINGFCSAGSTGAMMVGTMFTVKTIEGIMRPCISTFIPLENGGVAFLVDAGLNADCKPEVLDQFAILGSTYAKHVMGIDNPRVALLNIGEESEKGNMMSQEAHKLLLENNHINFVGNIEGNKLFSGKIADVIVCDGFTGNIVLKEAEAMYILVKKQGIKNDYFDRFNYELYGGTPVLGVNAPVVIGHGHSSPKAICNMILQTEHVIAAGLVDKIKSEL